MLCDEFKNAWRELLNFNCHSSRAATGISCFRVPTKDDQYSTNWRDNIVAVINRDRVIDANLQCQGKLKTKYCILVSCIILKKKGYVVSKLFLLNCIFHYISNWSKVF